jgi:hypothetical protein
MIEASTAWWAGQAPPHKEAQVPYDGEATAPEGHPLDRCFSRADVTEAVEREVSLKHAEIVELRRLLRSQDTLRLRDCDARAGVGADGDRGGGDRGAAGSSSDGGAGEQGTVRSEAGGEGSLTLPQKTELDLLRNILNEMQAEREELAQALASRTREAEDLKSMLLHYQAASGDNSTKYDRADAEETGRGGGAPSRRLQEAERSQAVRGPLSPSATCNQVRLPPEAEKSQTQGKNTRSLAAANDAPRPRAHSPPPPSGAAGGLAEEIASINGWEDDKQGQTMWVYGSPGEGEDGVGQGDGEVGEGGGDGGDGGKGESGVRRERKNIVIELGSNNGQWIAEFLEMHKEQHSQKSFYVSCIVFTVDRVKH